MKNTHATSRFASLTALSAAVVIVPALALAAISKGDVVGTTEAEVTARLTEQGYTVREIEMEDAEFEAEVVMNGEAFEITIDSETGQVTDIEIEDGEEDSD